MQYHVCVCVRVCCLSGRLTCGLPDTTARHVKVEHPVAVQPVDGRRCHCDVSHDAHQLDGRVHLVEFVHQQGAVLIGDAHLGRWFWVGGCGCLL